MCIFVPIVVLIAFVIILNVLQSKKKTRRILPNVLKTWNFLPIWLRSLKPYDTFLLKTICRCKRFNQIQPSDEKNNEILEITVQKEKIELETKIEKF